jgi:hypothetical protein
LVVTITVFGDFENKRITGIVTVIDTQQAIFKMGVGYDWQLIDFRDVIGVDVNVVARKLSGRLQDKLT